MKNNPNVEKSFTLAKERYAEIGVDVDGVLKNLEKVPVSLHCWQGDDVGGFENFGGTLTGGIMATGNYPGKARTPEELRADAEKALSLIPGTHRFNLHAFYGEFGGKKVDRNEIEPKHFKNWIDWAKSIGIGLDFNPTCFSHPKSADGFTLSIRRQRHPPVLDRALPGQPRNRRRHGQGARHPHRHQRLDSRRHEGHARRPPRSARTARLGAG